MSLDVLPVTDGSCHGKNVRATPCVYEPGTHELGGDGPEIIQRPVASVLLVDANAPTREYAQSTLHECGFRVTVGKSSREALRFLRERAYDRSLNVDVIVASIDGNPAISALFFSQAKRFAPNARLILLASCPNSPAEEEAILDGVDHVICRPFDGRSLANAVQLALRLPKNAEGGWMFPPGQAAV